MDWWLWDIPDKYVSILIFVLPVLTVGYPLYKRWSNRRKLGTRDEQGQALGIEDPEALARGEEWAKTYDYRKDWAEKGYVILEEFDSLHGFTASYMEDLVVKMTSQGLRVTYESIQGTPAGVVTINQGHSLHILHCHKEDVPQGKKYLDSLFR